MILARAGRSRAWTDRARGRAGPGPGATRPRRLRSACARRAFSGSLRRGGPRSWPRPRGVRRCRHCAGPRQAAPAPRARAWSDLPDWSASWHADLAAGPARRGRATAVRRSPRRAWRRAPAERPPPCAGPGDRLSRRAPAPPRRGIRAAAIARLPEPIRRRPRARGVRPLRLLRARRRCPRAGATRRFRPPPRASGGSAPGPVPPLSPARRRGGRLPATLPRLGRWPRARSPAALRCGSPAPGPHQAMTTHRGRRGALAPGRAPQAP